MSETRIPHHAAPIPAVDEDVATTVYIDVGAQRHLSEIMINSYLSRPLTLLVAGPRAQGKTTLLRLFEHQARKLGWKASSVQRWQPEGPVRTVVDAAMCVAKALGLPGHVPDLSDIGSALTRKHRTTSNAPPNEPHVVLLDLPDDLPNEAAVWLEGAMTRIAAAIETEDALHRLRFLVSTPVLPMQVLAGTVPQGPLAFIVPTAFRKNQLSLLVAKYFGNASTSRTPRAVDAFASLLYSWTGGDKQTCGALLRSALRPMGGTGDVPIDLSQALHQDIAGTLLSQHHTLGTEGASIREALGQDQQLRRLVIECLEREGSDLRGHLRERCHLLCQSGLLAFRESSETADGLTLQFRSPLVKLLCSQYLWRGPLAEREEAERHDFARTEASVYKPVSAAQDKHIMPREEYEGYVERVVGAIALVTLRDRDGNLVQGEYDAAQLDKRGIGTGDRFRLVARVADADVHLEISPVPLDPLDVADVWHQARLYAEQGRAVEREGDDQS